MQVRYNSQGNRTDDWKKFKVSEGSNATAAEKRETREFIKSLEKDGIQITNGNLNPNNIFADVANFLLNQCNTPEWYAFTLSELRKFFVKNTEYELIPMIYTLSQGEMKSVVYSQSTTIVNMFSEQLMNCNDATKEFMLEYARGKNLQGYGLVPADYIPKSHEDLKKIIEAVFNDPNTPSDIMDMKEGKEVVYDSKNPSFCLIGDKGVGMKYGHLQTSILNVGNSNKADKPWAQGKFGAGRTSSLSVTDSQVILTRTSENDAYSLLLIQKGEYRSSEDGEGIPANIYYALAKKSVYRKAIQKRGSKIIPRIGVSYEDNGMHDMLKNVYIPRFSNANFNGRIVKEFKHGTKVKFFYNPSRYSKTGEGVRDIAHALYKTFIYESFPTNVHDVSDGDACSTFIGRDGDIEKGCYRGKLYEDKVISDTLFVKFINSMGEDITIAVPLKYGIIDRRKVSKEELQQLLHGHYQNFIHNDQIQASVTKSQEIETFFVNSDYAKSDMFIDVHTDNVGQNYINELYTTARDRLHNDTSLTIALMKSLTEYFKKLTNDSNSLIKRYDADIEKFINGANGGNGTINIWYNQLYKLGGARNAVARNLVEGANSTGSLNLLKNNDIRLCIRTRQSDRFDYTAIVRAIKEGRFTANISYGIYDTQEEARMAVNKPIKDSDGNIVVEPLCKCGKMADEDTPFEYFDVESVKTLMCPIELPLHGSEERVPGVMVQVKTEKFSESLVGKYLRIKVSASIKEDDKKVAVVTSTNIMYKLVALPDEAEHLNGITKQNKATPVRKAEVADSSDEEQENPQAVYGKETKGDGQFPDIASVEKEDKGEKVHSPHFEKPEDVTDVESRYADVEKSNIEDTEGIGRKSRKKRQFCSLAVAKGKNTKFCTDIALRVIINDGDTRKIPKILEQKNFQMTTVEAMIQSSDNDVSYEILRDDKIRMPYIAIPLLTSDKTLLKPFISMVTLK